MMKEWPDLPEEFESPSGPKYRKVAVLGRGGYGLCYEIKQEGEETTYALKGMAGRRSVQYARSEIKLHKMVTDHPNCVKLFEAFANPSQVFVRMEKCSGDTLSTMRHRRGSIITEMEARFLIGQVLDGLAYIHRKGIVHRDIKLSNIFLSEDMVPKIGDFGMACQGPCKPVIAGTRDHIPPEVTKHKICTPKRDMWALGVCLYRLLQGTNPFSPTTSLAETIEDATHGIFPLSEISWPAADLLAKLLDPSYETRLSAVEAKNHEFFEGDTVSGGFPRSSLTIPPIIRKGAELQNFPDLQLDEKLTDRMAAMVQEMRVWSTPEMCDENFTQETNRDAMLNPESNPTYWVTKYVRSGDEQKICFVLNDNTVGVRHSNGSGALLSPDGSKLNMISPTGQESFYTMADLRNLSQYGHETLDDLMGIRECIEHTPPIKRAVESEFFHFRRPFLNVEHKTETSTFFELSNGVWQIEFTDLDPISIVICSRMGSVTVIENGDKLVTRTADSFMSYGVPRALQNRLETICDIIDSVSSINNKQPLKISQ